MAHNEDWEKRLRVFKKTFAWAIEQLEGSKEVPKPLTKKRERTPEPAAEPEDFECEGQIWLDPPGPCVDKKNKNIKATIKHEKKNHTVCKDCKNAKANYLSKQRKLAKAGDDK